MSEARRLAPGEWVEYRPAEPSVGWERRVGDRFLVLEPGGEVPGSERLTMVWDPPEHDTVWLATADLRPEDVEADGGGWRVESVGWLVDGDITDGDLHSWEIRIGDIGSACAWRMLHERRPSWPTLRNAPNGLPLPVRRTDRQCDCQQFGLAPTNGEGK